MELLQYFIPLATFLLGVGFTFFIKKKERDESTVSDASKELANLSTEWYRQLHDILVTVRYEEAKNAEKAIYFYTKNRIVLPKFIRSIEILRKHNKASVLVDYSEELLDILTDFQSKSNEIKSLERINQTCYSVRYLDERIDCARLLPETALINRIYGSKAMIKYEETLNHIDQLIQNINREAGKLIG